MKSNYIIYILSLVLATLVVILFTLPSDNIHIVACNIGQGDSILIYSRNTQVLIDGGPGNKVVDCLNQHLAFWDRTIDLIVITHPQKDHYGGIPLVLENYKVKNVLATPLNASSNDYKLLKNEITDEGATIVNPVQGMKISVGPLLFEVLWPSEQFLSGYYRDHSSQNVLGAFDTKEDPNRFSVVLKMTYKEFDALFTGDLDGWVTDKISSSLSDIEYLKVPHHGSKNGLTQVLLDKTTPEVAVISAGKTNRYGHPHEEVIELLNNAQIMTLVTYDKSIDVSSDGIHWWVN